MRANWLDWKEAALDWVYPRRCGLCGLLDDRAICDTCSSELVVYDGALSVPNVDHSVGAYVYEGRAAQAVKRLKYERVVTLAAPMAERMRERFDEIPAYFDRVVPIPIHWRRRRSRGFNQAELLCEAFGRQELDKSGLVRSRATRPQAGLSDEARRTNLVGAFGTTRSFDGQSILLVDDVATSGHTASECARELRSAGAAYVALLVFAVG